ncbi:MAG: hypothetical protein ABSG84_11325 [Acidobacteriaceae bacterium]|jgi:hypothetical protein
MMKKIEMGTAERASHAAKVPGCRRNLPIGVVLAALVLAMLPGRAQAQTRIGPAPPVTYDNKFEVYGGLNYMNFKAGEDLPTRMNLGGGEFEGTWWVTPKIGIAGEYRGEAGTTQVKPNAQIYGIHRPLVYMNMGLGGVQYRWLKNQHAALNLHAYGGIASGVFDAGTAGFGPGDVNRTPAENACAPAGGSVDAGVGLYCDHSAPLFALGGSIDFNRSKNWAIRLSPDLILEHFGNEEREFFAISGGVVYRFPVRKNPGTIKGGGGQK